MTLIACEPNEVVTRYPILTSSLAKHGISMRFAPISRWLSWWHGKPELRDALMAPLLIAEAAQPAQSDRFFCMIFRGSSQTPNEGPCLRGRYNISFAAEKLLPDEPVWMEFEHNADGELSASQVSFDAAFALRPLPVNALSLHPSGHIWSYNNSAFAVSRKY